MNRVFKMACLLNRAVERLDTPDLNIIFHSPAKCGISISLAAKHIAVLKRAGLVRKLRRGRGSVIAREINSFRAVQAYIYPFIAMWNEEHQRFKRNMEAGK